MGLAVSVRFDFLDGKGKSSFTKIRVPNGFSIANYIEFAQGMASVITSLSSARITNASFVVGIDLATATRKAAALVGSDIAQKAMFGFGTAIAGFRTKLKLPAIWENLVNVGADTINQGDIDVTNFMSAMESGIVVTGGTVTPTDTRGNDIVDTEYAREFFRKT